MRLVGRKNQGATDAQSPENSCQGAVKGDADRSKKTSWLGIVRDASEC